MSQSPSFVTSFVTNQFVGDSDPIVDEVRISPPEDETPDQFIDKGKWFWEKSSDLVPIQES